MKRLRLERLETRRLLASIAVTSTMDAVDSDPGDGVCEISEGGPCTLRAAIQEANNLEGPDEINVPAGIYTLSLSGIDEDQSATGDLDIREELILRGAGSSDTVIDGDGIDRVLDIGSGAVTIQDFTIRGGFIQDDDFAVEGSGGGVRNEADLTINDSIITGNVASFGAGVANYNGTVRILRSVISGNGNDGTQRGGGVANYSNYDNATLEITDSTITGNRADTGGGMNNRTYDGVANATVTSSTISGNTAQNGGGISNQSVYDYTNNVAANVTILGSTISGNTADTSGGGIRSEADDGSRTSIRIANSTIAANEATSGDGGGIANIPSFGVSFVAITSVILSGNTAAGEGTDLSSDSTMAMFSLIENPLGHSISNSSNDNIVGQDPLLGPLAGNGGPTLTHLLLEGSPAIDQGSNPDALVGDQRGTAFARTFDFMDIANASDGTDIGAVEVGQVAATLDFGDAPDGISVNGTVRRYPTLLASDGARHQITSDGPTLGTIAPDAEANGQPNVSASGDDRAGVDDEDGLGTNPIELTPGETLTGVRISHDGGATGALLSSWIDFNLDGDWDDPGEQILTDLSVPPGASSTSLDSIRLPDDIPAGRTFIRSRISTQDGLTPGGEAMDGEVEDFPATVGAPPPQVTDLSLTQVVDNANPALGQDVTFTITLTNDGPDGATGVEVSDFLPFDLIFVRSTVSQGTFDEFDGIWTVGNLDAGNDAVLTITVTVDTSDPITNTVEVSASNDRDPDSTPDNGIESEDDQASLTLGTCLSAEALRVGMNQLTYSCATPGSFNAFVRGTELGSHTFGQYGTTVDIADAAEFAIAIADSSGVAVAFLSATEAEMDQTIRIQAFEIVPNRQKSNTLLLQRDSQLLRAGSVGNHGSTLSSDDLPAAVDAAIAHWEAIGVSAVELAAMRGTQVAIGELAGDVIGRIAGQSITLDRDAAGNGWFVDDSPLDGGEFAGDGEATQSIDLVTTLIHEFGHVIGLPDVPDPYHVMHSVLETGVRRLPTPNTNSRQVLDVNNDGVVTALDALIVINRLSRGSTSLLSSASVWIGAGDELYLDTNSDFGISTLDALVVINHLSGQPTTAAAGEGEAITERSQASIGPFESTIHRVTRNDDLDSDEAVRNRDWQLYSQHNT